MLSLRSHLTRVLIGCLLFLGGASLRAQETPETQALVEHWFVVQTNLQNWSADFVQTRSLKALSQPLVSKGKVWVALNRFRWELGNPVQTIALRQPDNLMIVYPKLKRAEKYPLGDAPVGPLKDALALLDATLPRSRAAMEEHFQLLSVTQINANLQMTLQPKSASARKVIDKIMVGFRTNDFSIATTRLDFADGSSLRNDFSNTVMNGKLPENIFEATLAPDIKVVEPLKGN